MLLDTVHKLGVQLFVLELPSDVPPLFVSVAPEVAVSLLDEREEREFEQAVMCTRTSRPRLIMGMYLTLFISFV